MLDDQARPSPAPQPTPKLHPKKQKSGGSGGWLETYKVISVLNVG